MIFDFHAFVPQDYFPMALYSRKHQGSDTLIRKRSIHIGPALTQLMDYLKVASLTCHCHHQGSHTFRRSSINVGPMLTQLTGCFQVAFPTRNIRAVVPSSDLVLHRPR